MTKLSTCLWFDNEAEKAAKFYASVFKGDAKILKTTRYPKGSMGKAGTVMTVELRIMGHTFIALNGGPLFKFNESVSFSIPCKTQKEVDYYWKKLQAGGGRPSQCGWLKDKFGVSWQVSPVILQKLFSDKNKDKVARVNAAMMTMQKIDIAAIKEAAASKNP